MRDFVNKGKEPLTAEEKQIVEDHLKWCRGVVHNVVQYVPSKSMWDWKDAEQVGYLAMCEAAKTFDPTKASFETYAAKTIRNNLAKLFKTTSEFLSVFDLTSSYENGSLLIEEGEGADFGMEGSEFDEGRNAVKVKRAIARECITRYRRAYEVLEFDSVVREILSDSSYTDIQRQSVEIAYQYAKGYPQVDMANFYGLSKQVVNQRNQKGIKIIEERMFGTV